MYLDKRPWWPFYLAVEFFLLAFIWLILSIHYQSVSWAHLYRFDSVPTDGREWLHLCVTSLPNSWAQLKLNLKKKIWSLRNEICFLEKVNISFLPVTKKPVSLDSRLSSVTMILSNSSQEGEIAVTYEALFWGTGSKRKWFTFFFRTTLFPILSVCWKTFCLGKIYTHIKEDISIRTQATSGSPQIHTVTSFPHKLFYPHLPTYPHTHTSHFSLQQPSAILTAFDPCLHLASFKKKYC